MLIQCLQRSNFVVGVASSLRVFLRDPENDSQKISLEEQAASEVVRLSALWQQHGAPDCWFCYHPYFKSPDLIGPTLCQRFNVPYVTAEASYSERRRSGIWKSSQDHVLASLKKAAVNICFTERDEAGLREAAPDVVLARLRPFIDLTTFSGSQSERQISHLVTVAMMRAGDKMESYKRLAAALKQLDHLSWTLSIVGDGALRSEVMALFSKFSDEKVRWRGVLQQSEIAELLSQCSVYLWPGCGEAYGLAYLEAQASGLPVVAYDTAGVPEVVVHEKTGLLTPENNDEAYAEAVAQLLNNPVLVRQLSANAIANVQNFHSLNAATADLRKLLQKHVGL